MKTKPRAKLIKSVDELRAACDPEEAVNFAIQLNGPIFSRKEIFYHNDLTEDEKYRGKFEVTNCIDDTTQLLTPEEISDPESDITNIGKAMANNAFFKMADN